MNYDNLKANPAKNYPGPFHAQHPRQPIEKKSASLRNKIKKSKLENYCFAHFMCFWRSVMQI